MLHPDYQPATPNGHRSRPSIVPGRGSHLIKSLVAAAGITRISDVTGLDCIGVPTFITVRPAAAAPERTFSVYNGIALTKRLARFKAVMEAWERSCAERRVEGRIFATYRELSSDYACLHPADSGLTNPPSEIIDWPLDWLPAENLLTGQPTYVPENQVVCPYYPTPGAVRLGPATSSGVAAGQDLEDATVRGILERIERDAVASARHTPGGRISMLDPSTVPGPIKNLLVRCRQSGIGCALRRLPAIADLPAAEAFIWDTQVHDPFLINGGMSAALDPETAATRALLEAIQSRATVVNGIREDMPRRFGTDRSPAAYCAKLALALGAVVALGEVLTWTDFCDQTTAMERAGECHPAEQLAWLLERLGSAGVRSIARIRLTNNSEPRPVVSVLVGGASDNYD